MTGNDLFGLTMAVLSEDEGDNAEFKCRCVRLINHLLEQTFAVNNGLRRHKGLERLAETPAIAALGDEVPYEDELVNGAFPYGLAEKYVFDENDFQKVGYFNGLYVRGVNDAWRAEAGPVKRVY